MSNTEDKLAKPNGSARDGFQSKGYKLGLPGEATSIPWSVKGRL